MLLELVETIHKILLLEIMNVVFMNPILSSFKCDQSRFCFTLVFLEIRKYTAGNTKVKFGMVKPFRS